MNKKLETILYIIMCVATGGAMFWARLIITKAILIAKEQTEE